MLDRMLIHSPTALTALLLRQHLPGLVAGLSCSKVRNFFLTFPGCLASLTLWNFFHKLGIIAASAGGLPLLRGGLVAGLS